MQCVTIVGRDEQSQERGGACATRRAAARNDAIHFKLNESQQLLRDGAQRLAREAIKLRAAKSENRFCTAASFNDGALSKSRASGTACNTFAHSAIVLGDSFMALLNEPNTTGIITRRRLTAPA